MHIHQNLLRVLDKHKKDSIQGRVFRIFGNICDAFEPIRLMQKEAKVISVTNEFLIEYAGHSSEELIYSVPTVSMALRYTRKMLSVLTYNSLVHDYKIILTIGMVLIKCSKNWTQNKKDDVLITDILKILQIITSPSYKYSNLILDVSIEIIIFHISTFLSFYFVIVEKHTQRRCTAITRRNYIN